MTKEQAEDIECIANEKGYEIEVRSDYSGRGMRGRTTYAVVGKESEVDECLDESEVCYDAGFWSDSMGRDVVYY